MGKKRKHERTEEEIRRKIQKLQNKLSETTNDYEPLRVSQESLSDSPPETPYSEYPPYYCESELATMQYVEEESQPSSLCLPSTQQPLSTEPTSVEIPPPQPTPPVLLQSATTEENDTKELELDDDTLQLLGDAPVAETPLGPPIHKDVARRWQDILAKGLSKDVKESLTKEYLIPSNCDLLVAPALNPEVKAALPDPLVKRYTSLLYKQKQLGIALSALAAVTGMVISNETSKQKILKPLSDACRLLCDSHYAQSNTRRGFVISSINSKLKQTLIDSSRDQLLFGENVLEKLKTAKTIQQSGEALKNVQKPRFQRPNIPSTSGIKGHLNFVPQHRKTDTKPTFNRRVSNYPQRQAQAQNNSSRRPNDRDRYRPNDRDRYRPSTSKTSIALHRK